jgi:hypothetical protein
MFLSICHKTVCPIADLLVRYPITLFHLARGVSSYHWNDGIQFYFGNVILIAFKERLNPFGCLTLELFYFAFLNPFPFSKSLSKNFHYKNLIISAIKAR